MVGHLAGQGWRLEVLDLKGPKSEIGGDVASHELDLLDATALAAAVRGIFATGTIDLVVNCVGFIWNEPIIKMKGARLTGHDLESWRRVLDANLTAPFAVIAAVAPRLARQKTPSCIVNVGSIAARGNPGQAAYAAAKAGLGALTVTAAAELGPLGVRCNAVAPGFIDTPSTAKSLSAERLQTLTESTPMQRLGRAEEVAAAIEMIWRCEYINGAVIPLDGGLRNF